mmetsp:Transcript_79110/g.139643  ORF Transcript_79110/g.139643 Transcript_79110/m.139643 type:complete len:200 (+) Transcript_79110:7000-7599(+)
MHPIAAPSSVVDLRPGSSVDDGEVRSSLLWPSHIDDGLFLISGLRQLVHCHVALGCCWVLRVNISIVIDALQSAQHFWRADVSNDARVASDIVSEGDLLARQHAVVLLESQLCLCFTEYLHVSDVVDSTICVVDVAAVVAGSLGHRSEVAWHGSVCERYLLARHWAIHLERGVSVGRSVGVEVIVCAFAIRVDDADFVA